MGGGKVLFIPLTGANGPALPGLSGSEQTTDCVGECPWVARMDAESGFWRIDNLATGIKSTHQTRPPQADGLKIDEAKPFGTARQRQTAALYEQALFFPLRHPAVKMNPER